MFEFTTLRSARYLFLLISFFIFSSFYLLIPKKVAIFATSIADAPSLELCSLATIGTQEMVLKLPECRVAV